jgi:DNA-binding XRE family transcriptional regulator
MRLRNRVLATREGLALSQHELSRRTGLSRMTLRAVERDDGYEPNSTVMTMLCEALDAPDLFWWEREPAEPMLEPAEAAAS